MNTIKLRSGFADKAGVAIPLIRFTGFAHKATSVPGSECLNRDGQPIGAEFDEFARMPTAEERDRPVREMFNGDPEPSRWNRPGLSKEIDWDLWSRFASAPGVRCYDSVADAIAEDGE